MNEYDFAESSDYSLREIRKVQTELTKMGHEITEVLSKHGIDYFLAFGSLLGAKRLGTYFPWDDDFDLFLFDDSYEDAISTLEIELPDHLFIHNVKNDPLYFKSWSTVKNKDTRVVMNYMNNIDNYLLSYPSIHVDLYRLKKMPLNQIDNYKKNEAIKFLEKKLKTNLIDINKFQVEMAKIQEISDSKSWLNSKSSNSDDIFNFMIKLKNPLQPSDVFPLTNINFDGIEFKCPNNIEAILQAMYGDYELIPDFTKRVSHYKKVIFLNN